jgi:hypothetical protein
MPHSRYFLVALLGGFLGCAHQAPAAERAKPKQSVHIGLDPVIRPFGERLAFQFNDEPPVILVSDGRGGPPIMYHGKPLSPERVVSIRSLNANAARVRFGDQTLVGAFLVELK